MNDTTYEAGERVALKAVRNDLAVTVLGQEGSLVTVRVEGTGQIVKVPAGVLYR
jgi:hypothetical protein